MGFFIWLEEWASPPHHSLGSKVANFFTVPMVNTGKTDILLYRYNFWCWSQCAVQTRCWEYLGKKSTYCPSIPHELSMNSPFPHFLAVFPSLSPTNCHQHHILSLVAPHQNLSNPLFVNVILTKRFWECNSGNLCGENIDANLGLLMDLYDGC